MASLTSSFGAAVRAALPPWRFPPRKSRRNDELGWSGASASAWPWMWGPWGKSDDLKLADARWLSATQRCIGLLSDSISSPPIYIVQAVPNGGRVPVTSTDASRALALLSFHDRECLGVSLLADGNGFARLRRNDRGGVAALEPIAPWRVMVAIDEDGSVWYRIGEDATLRQPAIDLPASEILHIRFRPSSNSHFLLGVPPLAAIATSLETVLRVADGARTYFRNLSLPSFMLSTDLVLDEKQIALLREKWDATTKGEGLGGVPILTAGLKGTAIPRQTALESQLLEMSKLSVNEIGRAYGVPSSYLNETSAMNFATAAEMTRSLVTSTLAPLAQRVADAMSQALLSRDERLSGMSVTIDLSELVSGFGSERAEYASKLVNAGLASVNELRDTLGYPDVDNGGELRAPVNTMPLDTWILGGPQPVALGTGAQPQKSSRRIRQLRRQL